VLQRVLEQMGNDEDPHWMFGLDGHSLVNHGVRFHLSETGVRFAFRLRGFAWFVNPPPGSRYSFIAITTFRVRVRRQSDVRRI
jgi:hypothetical protein